MAESAVVEADMQRLPRAAEMTDTTAAPYGQTFAAPVRALLWIGGSLLALLICLQWGTTTSVHQDFTQNVWLPARLVLNGVDPYNPTHSQVGAALGEFSKDFAVFNSGANYHFIYPLWLALVFSPFGMLPLLPAIAIWRAANIMLLIWAMGAVLRASNPRFRSTRPAVLAAISVTVLLGILPTFRPGFLTIYHGQFAIIEFALLAAIWGWFIRTPNADNTQYAIRNTQLIGDVLVGVALAALATKPQAVGLPIVLIGLWAIARRRWAIPVAAVISYVLLIVVPNLFYSWSLSDWLGVVFGGQATSQVQVSASVWGVAYQWFGGSLWMPLALLLTVVGLLFLVPHWWRDLKDRTSPVPLSLPLTLCVGLVISPYMLGYEHVLLLFPALVILAWAGLPGEQATPEAERSARLWREAVFTWLALLPFIVLAAQAVTDREYPAILQSATMLIMCWKVGRFEGLNFGRSSTASLRTLEPANVQTQ